MRSITILSLLLLLPPLLQAEGPAQDTPHSRLTDPRPEISDYEHRDDFVRDILAWKKRNSESGAQHDNSAGNDSVSQSLAPLDWHHVTGPEDLDIAIRNAEGYVQPHYQQTYRFDRTTHISFPLSRLEREQLAEKRVDAPSAAANANLPPEDLTLKPEQTFLTEERLFSENLQQRLSTPIIKQGPSVEARMD